MKTQPLPHVSEFVCYNVTNELYRPSDGGVVHTNTAFLQPSTCNGRITYSDGNGWLTFLKNRWISWVPPSDSDFCNPDAVPDPVLTEDYNYGGHRMSTDLLPYGEYQYFYLPIYNNRIYCVE